MLIAHEAPLCIMPYVQALTDYDYCLVHLLEESKEYENYFIKAKEKGRKIIMDCSLFELGHAFDSDKYYNWLLKIQPDEYIVPDVWQSAGETLASFETFSRKYDLKALKGIKIGVLQGTNHQELVNIYKFMDANADKIAISFGYDYYLTKYLEKEPPYNTKPNAYTRGRMSLINEMLVAGVINKDKPHHLLGCGLPVEFNSYRYSRYSFIQSIDTSHPVTSGYLNRDYDVSDNLMIKPDMKMLDIFNETMSEEQIYTALKNVRIFRENSR
jgi:hypothetical protein